MIKIAIVDDQDLIRESIGILLNSNENFEVDTNYKNGQEIVDASDKEDFDIILMDIRMPLVDGVEATKIIKDSNNKVKIIILTTFDDDEYIFKAIANGASGFLLKGCSLDELTLAINNVYTGGSILHPTVATKAFEMFSKLADNQNVVSQESEIESSLNETEIAIIKNIVKGKSNKEIAKYLDFSEGTIRNYLSSLLDKLSLRDRTQLAIWAIKTGRYEE